MHQCSGMTIQKTNRHENEIILFVLFIFVAGICACSKDDIEETFAGFQKPAHFPSPFIILKTIRLQKKGFELGRKLFYDPILSGNNTISCGTCHMTPRLRSWLIV